MLPFLASLLAKPIVKGAIGLPWLKILPVVAVMSFIGAREVHHWREHRQERAATAAAVAWADAEHAVRLQAEKDALEYKNNRDALAAELRRQNDAIGQFAEKAKADQAEAVLTAVRRLELGRASANLLRQPTTIVPPGHAAMNHWIEERFGGQP
jgi:hypothetical protein